MFTGLVELKGKLARRSRRGPGYRLLVEAALGTLTLGESISVSGACLTVIDSDVGGFEADVSMETANKTTLGALPLGAAVNLERALRVGDRLGGHLVSGHVDCLATVADIKPAGESRVYTLTFPAEHGAYVIPKGSITLDGISLTVNDCGPEHLSVNIIPATQRETTISGWSPGTKVNMETDLIGKYVRSMLGPWVGGAGAAGEAKPASKLSMDFLREHGF